MRTVSACAVILVLALGAGAAQAQMVLIDDFSGYEADSSIHLQGDDGTGVPLWYCQANVGEVPTDSNRAIVVNEDGDQCLRVTTEDHVVDGQADGNVAAMSLWGSPITGLGTIYFRFKSDGLTNDIALQTNDFWAGWDYSGMGDINTPGFQGNLSSPWSDQGVIAFFAGHAIGDGNFRGYNGGYVDKPGEGANANEWTEFWVQVDQANDRTKYFICPDGGTPHQLLNASGGEWWQMRNQTHDNDAVKNLRFQFGQNGSTVSTVYLDTIGINVGAMTLERLDPRTPNACIPGDADCDGTVAISDFVLLKNNFGANPATWGQGDFDGDGTVAISDFVILKNNFGATAVPEPATILLMTTAGLPLLLKRKRSAR